MSERREIALDETDGLWIPPELREFDRQIIIRTPRGTIQHFGSEPLDAYYPLVDKTHFGSVEELPESLNPELAPDRVQFKPQGEEPVEFEVCFQGGDR